MILWNTEIDIWIILDKYKLEQRLTNNQESYISKKIET